MSSTIADNLARVRERIAAAARRAGRSPDEVTLVAVSKTQPGEAVRAAYEAGQRVFGENYVQEAMAKMERLPSNVDWHMIGHLQTNKARIAAAHFQWVQTLDSLRLANALERHAEAAGRPIDALIQVNLNGEADKSGVTDEPALREMLSALTGFRALRVRGLMTIPDPTYDEKALRQHFSRLRELRTELASEFGLEGRFSELSMGMSHDFEWAVEEGATLVRVGTAIFGARI